jgi:hypothetical protein
MSRQEYPDDETVLTIVNEFLFQNTAWTSRAEECRVTARRLAEFLKSGNVPLFNVTWADVRGFQGETDQVDAILRAVRNLREGSRLGR